MAPPLPGAPQRFSTCDFTALITFGPVKGTIPAQGAPSRGQQLAPIRTGVLAGPAFALLALSRTKWCLWDIGGLFQVRHTHNCAVVPLHDGCSNAPLSARRHAHAGTGMPKQACMGRCCHTSHIVHPFLHGCRRSRGFVTHGHGRGTPGAAPYSEAWQQQRIRRLRARQAAVRQHAASNSRRAAGQCGAGPAI